ncbi:hypothetical protein FOMPIDRAFT_1053518 [Fomitopsis schrenkii]|uniref:C2H2-type domain-containing protein n=1 Tax=Fomitopsis schrenkii TaxID=2126942 RepID=S8DSC8_FOMSC|nr:hypothetical protein FOMPIDRAFT_1053518 [Fomitopsis schrenkii]
MIAIDALTNLRAHASIRNSPHQPDAALVLHRRVTWTRTTSSSSSATFSSAPDLYPSGCFSSDEDISSEESSSHRTLLPLSFTSRRQVGTYSGESEVEGLSCLDGEKDDEEGAGNGHQDDVKEVENSDLDSTRRDGLDKQSTQTLRGSSVTLDLTDESASDSDSDTGSTYSDVKRRASTSRRQSRRPLKRRRAQIQREDSHSSSSSVFREQPRARFKRRPQAMPEVHNAKARRYACRIPGCTWAFARSPERSRHEATHNERETWKCGHCGLLLSRKDSALRHHYTQHLGEEVQIARTTIAI